jgi:hypothetical protein
VASSQTKLILLPWLWVVLTGCHVQSAAPKPQLPATILIIRHAEKLDNGESDLSSAGFDRAGLLPNAFYPGGSLPTPQVIFAAAESAHSNRSVQTVTPLAEALHLPIDDRYSDYDYKVLAAELLSGEYAGKIVLIAWHHGRIPQLAAALGATPPYNPWPAQQYDHIWRINYVNGKATLRDLPYPTPSGDSR